MYLSMYLSVSRFPSLLLSRSLRTHSCPLYLERTRPLSYSRCLPLRSSLPLLLPASPPTLAYGLYALSNTRSLARPAAVSTSFPLSRPSYSPAPSLSRCRVLSSSMPPAVSLGFSLFLGSLSVRRRMSPAFESIGRTPTARGVPLPLLASSPTPRREPILPATFFFAVPSDLSPLPYSPSALHERTYFFCS